MKFTSECIYQEILKKKGLVECQHRIQAAWYNFHKYQKVLTNGNISTITPRILFGMSALPIYQWMMDKIDVARRKMLREMVGWVRFPEADWFITMRRMNERVNRVLVQWLISKDWAIRIFHCNGNMHVA